MTDLVDAAMPRPGDSVKLRENRQLTGLRGIAAVDVMIGHFNSGSHRWLDVIDDANLAVDLFFCLSAFMLCLVYRAGADGRLDWRGFAAARVARIYPLYLVALALGFYTTWIFSAQFSQYHGSVTADLVRQSLLVNVWPVIGNGVSWDAPAWSVSVEALCYVVAFPVLVRLSKAGAGLSAAQRTGLIVLLGFAAYVGFLKFFNSEITYAWHGIAVPRSALWVLSFRGVAMFAAGWLAYLSYAARDTLAIAAGGLIDAIALLFLLLLLGQSLQVDDRQIGVMLCPFLVLGLARDGSWTARVLASRMVHYLGVISFSIYVLHIPIMYIATFHFPALVQQAAALDHPVLRVVVLTPVTILAASLTYWLIEAPGRRVLRRVLGR